MLVVFSLLKSILDKTMKPPRPSVKTTSHEWQYSPCAHRFQAWRGFTLHFLSYIAQTYTLHQHTSFTICTLFHPDCTLQHGEQSEPRFLSLGLPMQEMSGKWYPAESDKTWEHIRASKCFLSLTPLLLFLWNRRKHFS